MTLQEAQNILSKNGYYGSIMPSFSFRKEIENYCKTKSLRNSNSQLDQAVFRLKQELSNPKSKFGKN